MNFEQCIIEIYILALDTRTLHFSILAILIIYYNKCQVIQFSLCDSNFHKFVFFFVGSIERTYMRR